MPKTGIIPLIVVAAAFALILVFDLENFPAVTSPDLILIFNTVFLTVIGLTVAVISAKSYLSSGQISLLLLGMATATAGLAAAIGGWGARLSVNYDITLLSLGFLLSGGLQLLSAFTFIAGSAPIKLTQRKKGLIIGYSAIIITLTVVSALVFLSLSPAFFRSSGPTLTEDWALGAATAFFGISSLILGWKYFNSKSQIVYWYALGVALFTLGMFGLDLFTTPNALLNWVARCTLYLAVSTF